MKQLLIVKRNSYFSAQNAGSLASLTDGQIAFFALNAEKTTLLTKPASNFGIALGRPNSPAFVIPEVDLNTLDVVLTSAGVGQTFSATIAVPNTISDNSTYTLMLIKKGTVPHERNTWTVTVNVPAGDTTTTANDIAAKFRTSFNAYASAGLGIAVSGSNANVTITGTNKREDWVLKGADDMSNVALSSYRAANPPIGDVEYIKDLASQCAAGKGFNYVEGSGKEIYPGYPEELEHDMYNIYTLRFKVGRDSSKTRDEKVWQLVHIAVPSTLDTINQRLQRILIGAGEGSSDSISTADDSE